jgi:hypothetical protein
MYTQEAISGRAGGQDSAAGTRSGSTGIVLKDPRGVPKCSQPPLGGLTKQMYYYYY